MTRPSVVRGMLLAVAAAAAAGCAAPLDGRRFEAFEAEVDAGIEEVRVLQDRAAALPASDGRDDELLRLEAAMRVLHLVRAGGAVAYLDDDAAALRRLEARVDETLSDLRAR